MSDPILDPAYWKDKLYDSFRSMERHRAIYNGSVDEFNKIEAYQRAAVNSVVGDYESVIDLGCGYGRLLDLMPKRWKGLYLGVDVSPDLVEVARRIWPDKTFVTQDIIARPITLWDRYDLAVMVWMRSMILKYDTRERWERLLEQAKRYAKRVLVIDEDCYDVYEER